MHNNFWSKLHFYMKFLKYVSYSIEYLCSEVQLPASPLCFLSHSVAVAALSEISHVACRALDDSFWAFLSSTMQEPLRPPNNIFWALIQEKMIILSPFHSKAIVLLYKFETSWTFLGGRPWPGVKFFFFAISGVSKLCFSWTCSRATSLGFLFCTWPSLKLF